jgi:hypothetical protein
MPVDSAYYMNVARLLAGYSRTVQSPVETLASACAFHLYRATNRLAQGHWYLHGSLANCTDVAGG